ncbi:hypothetical protein OB955_24035 [Halobacteria archaeon AArc-m2/3/4]|uniref:CARDB domain-containing protein n=1 Tax=Natronoglomus mannanivorans TaxID=2979990 RepID=A0AAP3E251_9EURY|nr:hypothetical protein [Halobacteria archaeon AArc-xg1-1]MCU4975756.1 hypothetical protein [Halobacteria archaeon AArc-m2/3/4]
MSRRVDERAVTVQIGAVLLLAILVSALALYQVTAVPDQNHETEFTHNERVTGELVELRDTIRNAGSERLERGVPMTLGAQYQTRTVAINPPAPSGRISTSEPRPVTIENADASDSEIQTILDDPPTTRLLTYEPRYNEYRGPTTRIEHSLLYNEFGEANVTLEEQTMIDDDSVTLVFLEGDLSRSTTGTVSVDVETIGGPTGESTFKSNESGNVTITLPTDSPERWEVALGTTFEESRENTRIQPDDDRGNVTIELANETYTLRLAQVSVGDDGEPDERFDAARASGSGSESGTGSGSGDDAFTTQWSGEAVNTDGGESELRLEEGQSETVDLTVRDSETNDPITNVWVDFARQSGEDGAVSFTEDTQIETDDEGTASIDVRGDSAGETVLFASTASGTVRLPVTVEPIDLPADEPYFDVQIIETNTPVPEGESLTVDVAVENLGEQPGTQTIRLTTEDGTERDSQDVELEAGEGETIVLEWATQSGDGSESDQLLEVESDDTGETVSVRIEPSTAGAYSVFAVGDQTLGNNENIDSTFTIDMGDRTVDVAVSLVDQSGGGSAGSNGKGWQTKQVTIDGTVLELETAAADDIAVNSQPRNLLNESTYTDEDVSTLAGIRDDVDSATIIRDEQHFGSAGLAITVEEY